MSITNKLNQIKNAIYGKEVRGAIHDAIKQVYDDASVNHDNANMEVKMARGTHNTLNDRLDNVDEIQAQTNAQLSQKASEQALAVERARIDNIVSLSDGSTTGDAELIDLRVDYLGRTHSNAGTAVREQVTKLNDDVDLFKIELFGSKSSVNFTVGGLTFDKYNPQETDNESRLRTAFVYATKGSSVISTDSNLEIALFEYDKNQKFIAPENLDADSNFFDKKTIINEATRFIRILVRKKDNTTIDLSSSESINISLITPKIDQNEYKEIKKSDTEWFIRALQFENGQPSVNQTRLSTKFVRAKKGTIIKNLARDTYQFAVFEYHANVDGGLIRPLTADDWLLDEYKVQNDNCEFIKVVMKKHSESVFADTSPSKNIAIYPVVRDKDIEYVFNPNVPNGYYVEKNPYHDDKKAVDYLTIYSRYDGLVSDFPDYVTKKELGCDQSGQYPIYQYIFTPKSFGLSGVPYGKSFNSTQIPVVIIDSAIHGEEKPSVLALLNTMENVCRRWKTDEKLSYLRWNFQFVITPIANPYGYVNNIRHNVNGVDINRNFNGDGRWSNGSDEIGSQGYRGTSPFSETETKYISNTLNDYKDNAFIYMNLHTFGQFDAYQNMTAFNTTSILHSDKTAQIGFDITRDITLSGWVNHNLNEASGWIGTVGISTNAGLANAQAAEFGMPSITPECMYKYFGVDNEWSSDVNAMNVEYITNTLLHAIRRLQ